MKLKLGLVPGFFIRALAVPFMLGEAKYARGDWAKQGNPEQFVQDRLDSAMRHATDLIDGVIYDEDGQHNGAAAAWGFLVVTYYRCVVLKLDELFSDIKYPTRLEQLRAQKNLENLSKKRTVTVGKIPERACCASNLSEKHRSTCSLYNTSPF